MGQLAGATGGLGAALSPAQNRQYLPAIGQGLPQVQGPPKATLPGTGTAGGGKVPGGGGGGGGGVPPPGVGGGTSGLGGGTDLDPYVYASSLSPGFGSRAALPYRATRGADPAVVAAYRQYMQPYMLGTNQQQAMVSSDTGSLGYNMGWNPYPGAMTFQQYSALANSLRPQAGPAQAPTFDPYAPVSF